MSMMFLHLGMIFAASIAIMYACNSFEQSASYLGRNMGAGSRGALLDAIGSSLPELMVTFMFVATGKPELILAGVAVTAGSAIFNIVLIPALSILVARDKFGDKVSWFSLDSRSVARDGIWLLAVEGILLYFLGMDQFTLGMCGILLGLYVMYAMHVMYDSVRLGNNDSDDYEFESLESPNKLVAALTFDFNKLLFSDRPMTMVTSWTTLLLSVGVIGVACHYLATGIEGFANDVGIAVYFAAVVLGAAATSVPDTILSVKSARRGDYEDAVGNAVGSNLFDVTVSLALPMALYMAVTGGVLPIEQSADLTVLRWFVFGTSAIVIIALFAKATMITRNVAWFLLSLYAVWIGYIISTL